MSEVIVFVCPHNVAKSLIAASYFNVLAEQSRLPMAADSAGSEPEESVPQAVIDMLKRDGIDVSAYHPHRIRAEELLTAKRVISMGCSPETLGVAAQRVEQWRDVPPFSQNPDGTCEAIRFHVEQLIRSLSGVIE